MRGKANNDNENKKQQRTTDTTNPVSYTHLDVYKRQRQNYTLARLTRGRGVAYIMSLSLVSVLCRFMTRHN